MRTRNRLFKRRSSRAFALVAMLAILVLGLFSGTALAAWSDASESYWAGYSTAGLTITGAKVATVASGYPDGSFKPGLAVNRGQFAKMAVDGLGLPTSNPATRTFSDVVPSSTFYRWIEGGVAAGIIGGYTDRTYRPGTSVSRQGANSILGLYLSQAELASGSHVLVGDHGSYGSLAAWYAAEGAALLLPFADRGSLASVHAPATAYLVYHDVLKGSARSGGLYLDPVSSLTRAQAVVLILRVDAVTFSTGVPTVTSVNPSVGPAEGGNSVVITGTNFTGVTAVKFYTFNATSYVVNSATQITAVAPAGLAGSTVDVRVTNAAGQSAAVTADWYTYGTPSVTLLNPNGGAATGGNSVVITGTNFAGATAVRFGVVNATSYVVNSATQITAVAPAGTAGTVVDVTVTTAAGTSPTAGTGNDYSYGLPTVTALNPTGQATTAAGTAVTITGTNFAAGATVAFGTGYPATSVAVVNATTITCVSPAHSAGVVDVTVTTTAGTSPTAGTGNDYSYGLPTVTALNPTGQATTAAGTAVTITGTGFVAGATVAFGGTAATSVVVVNATTITCVSPAHAMGVVDVTVTTPAGTSLTGGTANDYAYGVSKFAVTMSGGTTALSAAAKTAGTPFSVRVTAQSADGVTVTSYTGTVALTSDAFVGTVNAVITTGGLVDGIVITPTISGAGSRTIAASDGSTTTTNASGLFTVTGGVTKFAVTMTGGTTALSAVAKTVDTPFSVRVTAQDAVGNPVPSYAGTVALTSNAFVGTVNAVITTGGLVDGIVILPTVAGAADRTISASGPGPITTTNASGNFTVVGGVAKFAVTMSGGTTALSAVAKTAGTPFSLRVTAQTATGVTVPGYTGTVTLTSTAFAGTVNAVITTGGLVDGIVITPTIAGTADRTITASQGLITTTNASGNFTVIGGVTKFAVTMSGGTTALSAVAKTAGTPFSVRVTAQDAADATVTSYTGTVALTSNAFAGTVYATITTGGIVGDIAIMPTIVGAADRTITATQGPIATTNASGNFTVNAGDASKFAVTMSGGTTALGAADKPAGASFNVRVTAQDAYGNTDTAYTGTVALTSNAFVGTVNATIATGGLIDGIAIVPTITGTGGRVITASQGLITTADASGPFNVTGGVTKFAVTMSGSTTLLSAVAKPAGTSFNVRVTAQTAAGATVTSYAGTVQLTSNAFAGTVNANITTGGLVDGIAIVPTIAGAADRTITATQPGLIVTANASGSFTVSGGVTQFAVTMTGGTTELSAAAKTAGTSFDVRVTAQDASNATVSTYNGTVALTSNAFAGTVTATLASGVVNGITIMPTIAGAADRTIAAAQGPITTTNASGNFTVNAGDATKFAVTMTGGTTALSAAAKTAGTPFNVRVTAQDANGNTATTYTGTVALTSNAFAGTVNAIIATGGLVDGIAITPTIAGAADRTIDASGPGPITTTNASGNFTVNAGDATKFAVTMTGGTTALSAAAKTAGTPFNVRVTAQDANGNTATTYTGTVALTSNAFAGTVNAIIATGGLVDGIAITPTTSGASDRTITAAQSLITTANASGNFTVLVGAFAKLQILLPGETAAPGTATGKTGTPTNQTGGVLFSIIVNAVDANWNLVSSVHTIAITSSNGGASLPGNAALIAGTKTFTVTLTAGSWTITATDVTDGTKTANTSPLVQVN